MKQLSSLLLALMACVTFANASVKIGDLYYDLNTQNKTAEVKSQNASSPYWSTKITTADIPSSVLYNEQNYSVISIGPWAFYECSDLASVTIPNSVTSIGYAAFYACENLPSVAIPDSVTEIGYFAFENCTGLTTITIPNLVTSIGYAAFRGCTGLTEITIPNSVTEIGGDVFYGCTGLPVIDNLRYADTYLIGAVDRSLSSYTIKDGTRWIGGSAFNGCANLTSITISNSVTSIGGFAFGSCKNLISITIPDAVTSIADAAFTACEGLMSITCEAVTPPTCGSDVFFHVDKSIPLYVPEESIEAYKSANEWKEFYNIYSIDNQPSSIENGTLEGAIENKLLRNSQIFILCGDKTYTLTGAQVR